MEELISIYQHLVTAPEEVASVPDFFLATLELFVAGVVLAWFAAHLAKILISPEVGIANRNSLAVSWASLAVATVALVDMVVLLVLDRVPGWSAVAPHTAFATIMGVVAIVSVMGVRADLRQHRIFVETANKQSA